MYSIKVTVKRTATICITLKPKRGEETLTKNRKITKKTKVIPHTPTATVMRITTNDKKYHFSGKKKNQQTITEAQSQSIQIQFN